MMIDKSEFLRPLSRRAMEGAQTLSNYGWLSRCSDDFRAAMLSIAHWRVAEAGSQFIHNGMEKGGMFAIVTGTAEVSLFLGNRNQRMVHIAARGFWGGPRPMLGRVRQVALVARERVEWGFFPQIRIEELLAAHPGWWRHLAELTDDAMILAMQTMSDLSLQDNRKRAAAVLLRTAGCRNGYDMAMEPVITVSQADLAAMAVMSRNTFNAILSSFGKEGLVEHQYRNIVIVEPDRLRDLVDG